MATVYNMASSLHPLSALLTGILVTSLWQLLCSLWHVKIRQQPSRQRFLRFFAYFWGALAILAVLTVAFGIFFRFQSLFFGFQELLANWGSFAFVPFVIWYYILTIKDIRITLTKTV